MEWSKPGRRPPRLPTVVVPVFGLLPVLPLLLFVQGESFDFSGYPPQSEWEEVPSLRWLPRDLWPGAAASASTSRSAKEIAWISEGYVPLCRGHGKKVSDGGSFAFMVDSGGEKCLFLPASGLMVREDEDQFWGCTDAYRSIGKSSMHAVKLLRGYHLDIRGMIDNIAALPSGAEYAAYLVFRFSGQTFGFGLQEASLDIGGETSTQSICLNPEGCGIAGSVAMIAQVAMVPEGAADGWARIEMGRFLVEKRKPGYVDAEVARRLERRSERLIGLIE